MCPFSDNFLRRGTPPQNNNICQLRPTQQNNYLANPRPFPLTIVSSSTLPSLGLESSPMAEDQSVQVPRSEAASNQSRGGRRRGRGGGAHQQRHTDAQHPDDGRANISGRGSRPRGRGGRGGRDRQNLAQNTKPGPQESGGGSDGKGKSQEAVANSTEDADDREVCFICASEVEHISISPCNHRTCHICALRLRALYKTKACAHCRVRILPPMPLLHIYLLFSNRRNRPL